MKTPESNHSREFGITARTRSEEVLQKLGKLEGDMRVYVWIPKKGVGVGWAMALCRPEYMPASPHTIYTLAINDPEYRPGCGTLKFSEAGGIHADSQFPHRIFAMTEADWQHEVLVLLDTAFADEEGQR